jgi:phage tail-like protein
VHLCNAAGEPVVTWHIAKAVAVKLEAPALDPSDNAVAVETLEIMAAGISLEHH